MDDEHITIEENTPEEIQLYEEYYRYEMLSTGEAIWGIIKNILIIVLPLLAYSIIDDYTETAGVAFVIIWYFLIKPFVLPMFKFFDENFIEVTRDAITNEKLSEGSAGCSGARYGCGIFVVAISVVLFLLDKLEDFLPRYAWLPMFILNSIVLVILIYSHYKQLSNIVVCFHSLFTKKEKLKSSVHKDIKLKKILNIVKYAIVSLAVVINIVAIPVQSTQINTIRQHTKSSFEYNDKTVWKNIKLQKKYADSSDPCKACEKKDVVGRKKIKKRFSRFDSECDVTFSFVKWFNGEKKVIKVKAKYEVDKETLKWTLDEVNVH